MDDCLIIKEVVLSVSVWGLYKAWHAGELIWVIYINYEYSIFILYFLDHVVQINHLHLCKNKKRNIMKLKPLQIPLTMNQVLDRYMSPELHPWIGLRIYFNSSSFFPIFMQIYFNQHHNDEQLLCSSFLIQIKKI